MRIAACTGVCALTIVIASSAGAQTATPVEEAIEPRTVGTAGTMAVGFSGFVDQFVADDSLPGQYAVQADVSRFLTSRWAGRVGLVGSGSYGGDDPEDRPTGAGAPAAHALGGLFYYFTPRAMWSAYSGVEYRIQLTQRGSSTVNTLAAMLGIHGAVSSRTGIFIEGGFGRSLNRADDQRPSRIVATMGVRLKL